MIMGINLANTGTALPHRMQYPLGIHSGASHGRGLAALYPAWMRYEAKHSPGKVERILELLGVGRIEELLDQMGLPVSLKSLGITEETCGIMASEVKGNIYNDPAAKEPGVIESIYRKAWED